jgi:hypothetical protein
VRRVFTPKDYKLVEIVSALVDLVAPRLVPAGGSA